LVMKRSALEGAGIKLDVPGAKVLGIKLPDHPKTPKPSKYRNERAEYGGVKYDSKAEARRAETLDALVERGEVLWWIRQPTFRLGCPENVYRPDFLVVHVGGGVHVEDVKGHETAKFKKDRRLWESYGPCELWLIKGSTVEVLHPRKQGR
jgi:hypothetical protein